MAELADAEDLKSSDGDIVWVRPPPALQVFLTGLSGLSGHEADEASCCLISTRRLNYTESGNYPQVAIKNTVNKTLTNNCLIPILTGLNPTAGRIVPHIHSTH